MERSGNPVSPKGATGEYCSASQAARTGTEVILMATLYYSVHTSHTNLCQDAIVACFRRFSYLFLTEFKGVFSLFLA